MKKIKLALIIGTIFGISTTSLYAGTYKDAYENMSIEKRESEFQRFIVKLEKGYTLDDLNNELNSDFQIMNEKSLGFKSIITKKSIDIEKLKEVHFLNSVEEVKRIERNIKKKKENNESSYQAMSTPNDPIYVSQYHFQDSNDLKGGSSIQRAIKNLKSSNRTVKIAIIDSGSLPHEDIVFEGGQNIATSMTSNEERDREEGHIDKSFYYDYDLNPEEPVRVACPESIGHGLKVAGVIGATINNSKGVSGILDADLYSVRVTEFDCRISDDPEDPNKSKESLSIEDIADGILWSAGSAVSGVSTPIEEPVDIINISLGGIGETCTGYLQAAINYATNKGISVIVPSGNDGLDTSGILTSLSDCENVIVVSSNDIYGEISSYSNYGEKVDISAFGGEEGEEQHYVLSPSEKRNEYLYESGTSYSAPVVSGIIGLLKEKYENLNPEDVEYLLKKGAVETAAIGDGAGVANAYNSMKIAEQLFDYDVDFNHYYANTETCEDNKRVSLMNKYFNVCDLYKVSITQNSSDFPVSFEVVKKQSTSENWSENNITVVESISVNSGEFNFDYRFNEKESGYDYAVRICDEEGKCLNPKLLDFNGISKPSFCEE